MDPMDQILRTCAPAAWASSNPTCRAPTPFCNSLKPLHSTLRLVAPSAGNANVFSFLRARQRFVEDQAASERIDGFVIWAAAVDALGRIHAGRLGRSRKHSRQCFTAALLDLAPQHQLDRVSVPLLHHDIFAVAACLREHPSFSAYRKARDTSRLWTPAEDAAATTAIATFCRPSPDLNRLFRCNVYADILYIEYRCCAVHGLELGRKTCNPFGTALPHYMNYMYPPEDPRPPEHRYRTRIVFPLAYLAAVLGEMIAQEEQECAIASYVIPPYPTLSG